MNWLLSWCVWQIKKLRGQVNSLYSDVGQLRSRVSASSSSEMTTAIQTIFKNAGDPNGVVSVPHTFPSICIDTSTNIVWTKTDGVISNTGWGSP